MFQNQVSKFSMEESNDPKPDQKVKSVELIVT